jgi:hypothetical protein
VLDAIASGKERIMWWRNVLWGFWNGLTAWIVLIAHAFGAWQRFPLYDSARKSNWYALGFLIGAGAWSGGNQAGKRRGRKAAAAH